MGAQGRWSEQVVRSLHWDLCRPPPEEHVTGVDRPQRRAPQRIPVARHHLPAPWQGPQGYGCSSGGDRCYRCLCFCHEAPHGCLNVKVEEEPRAITDEDRAHSAYKPLRINRKNVRLVGHRKKRKEYKKMMAASKKK